MKKCIGCRFKIKDTTFEDSIIACPPEERTDEPCCNICKFDKEPYYIKHRCIFECIGYSLYEEDREMEDLR